MRVRDRFETPCTGQMIRKYSTYFRSASIWWLFLSLTLVPLMISGDSLWIDEAQTWDYARQPSLNELWTKSLSDHNSEIQMPLGMLWAWMAEKILGRSEVALRAANIPWLLIAIVSVWRVGRRFRADWLPVYFSVQPFLWQYANEARPYCIQISGACLVLLSFARIISANRLSLGSVLLFFGGSLIACSATMMGVLFIFVACFCLVWLIYHQRIQLQLQLHFLPAILFGALVFLLLGTYFSWTLMRGGGGVRLWAPSWQNAAFSIYELFGFGGLGPPRLILRDIVSTNILPPPASCLVWLLQAGLLGLVYLATFVIGGRIKQCEYKKRLLIRVCSLVFVGALLLCFAAGCYMDFAILGRHLSSVFPFIVCLIAMLFRPENGPSRVALLSLGGILLFSSLQLRFSSAYSREDYRAAATLAREDLKAGKRVWWSAAWAAGEYYGLKLSSDPNQTTLAFHAVNLQQLPEHMPDVVIATRPENFDQAGIIKILSASWTPEASPRNFKVSRFCNKKSH